MHKNAPVAHPVRYTVAPESPNTHIFTVTCTVEDPDPAGQAFTLPTWVPGSYLIREFARHFLAVRGCCPTGDVALDKQAKDTWLATPCPGPLTITADVYAFDLSVRTAYLDDQRAYFNGGSLFLCPAGQASRPCELEIRPPADKRFDHWRVATTMPSAGAALHGFGQYRAENYEALIDHPVEISDFAHVEFRAGRVTHEIVLTGRQDADLGRLATDLARVCQWHIELFEPASAEPPFDRYLFQVNVVGDGYGGLEHRCSTSLLCRRDELPRQGVEEVNDEYLKLLGLASHEYFHAWNVKRIKPSAFLPYDLSRENYTRQLWAFEGITSYYDDLALVRSALISPPRYLELLGRAVTSVLRGPGRLLQSVAESSFDAWVKFYRQDEYSPNAVVSYYVKGSLVALALDLLLRREGRGSLDDVMRALWTRHGRTGLGVPEDGIRQIASEIAGRRLDDFFARYVYGTADLPLPELLADFGVEYRLRAADGPLDRGGKPAAGPPPQASLDARIGADFKLLTVYARGAAERAGLAAGDQVVAIDSLKPTADGVRMLLAHHAPGERVRVHAFRRDELSERDVELAAPALDTCFMTLLASATPAAVARRETWLGA